jgi:two-component system sensor histidine kinase BaeS
MGRVLDQLLLLAQADAGTLRPRLEEIEIADLLEELAARWRGVAQAKQVEVVSWLPDSGTIAADPDLLRRALDNLVDNAIRYSPALGTVTMSARQQGEYWLLEVADQGPGVPEGLHETVFHRFVRADSVRTRRAGGAGLGLALGAAIADAHGGRLTLASRPEEGAVFQFRLPARPQPAPPSQPVPLNGP